MAASDNVLNVGFTPDKDSTRLVAKAVTATAKSPSELILRRQPYSKGKLGNTVVYSTPFEEFSIVKTTDTEALAPLDGPGIAIVTKAEGTTIWDRKDRQALDEASVRSVYFVAAGTELGIKVRVRFGWLSTMGIRRVRGRSGSSRVMAGLFWRSQH